MRPGELLAADTSCVGQFQGVGKVYPHTVVDTYGSCARWLVHYNTERQHLGYRNLGKRPLDTVNTYLPVMDEASSYRCT